MKDIPRVDLYQEQIERGRFKIRVLERVRLESELALIFEKPSAVFHEQAAVGELRVVHDAGQACHGCPVWLAIALDEKLS